MEALKAEIARKRKQMEATSLVGEKKFFKRGDLEAHQSQAYWDRYYAKNKARRPDQQVLLFLHLFHTNYRMNWRVETSKLQTDEPRTSVDGSEDQALAESRVEESDSQSMSEVRKGLRERGQPIQLFGETESESRRRLRKLQLEAPELNEGGRNEYMAAMHKVTSLRKTWNMEMKGMYTRWKKSWWRRWRRAVQARKADTML